LFFDYILVRQIIYSVLLNERIKIFSGCEKKPELSITQFTLTRKPTCICVTDEAVFYGGTGGLIRKDLNSESYRILTTIDGLPHNVVQCLTADEEGTVWIGTMEGLARLKDDEFTIYTKENGLPAIDVRSVIISPEGNLWVGTTNGLYEMKGKKFIAHSGKNGLSSKQISCLYFDRGGQIWVGTMDQAVYFLSRGKWGHFKPGHGPVYRYTNAITQTPEGFFWTATPNGLGRYNMARWNVILTQHDAGSSNITDCKVDSRGRFWISTPNSAGYYVEGKFTRFTTSNGLTSSDISAMAVGKDRMWLATSQGISSIDDEENVYNFNTPVTLSSNNIISVNYDGRGSVWLGTSDNGINRYVEEKWSFYTQKNGLLNNHIRMITPGPEDSFYFATTNGISIFKDKLWSVIKRDHGLAGKDVRDMVFDCNNRLWVATSSGISSISGNDITNYRTDTGIPSNDVWTCALDSTGAVWFGTIAGIVIFKNGDITAYDRYDGLANPDIRSITVTDDGTVFLGAKEGYLYQFKNGKLNVIKPEVTGTTKTLEDIGVDSKGIMWIASDGDGLLRYDGKKIIKYTTLDGIPGNHVRQLDFDQNGALWIGTHGGVARITSVSK